MSAREPQVAALTPLGARLAEVGPRLAARALGVMYEDPFWTERFGQRGKHHAGKDGDYHVQYLIRAVEEGDGNVFVAYARWLREVLASRGMCSQHLAENFELLAAEIDRERWPDGERATAMLHAGSAALRHDAGPAGDIDARRGALAETAAGKLYEAHPEWLARWGATGRARCVRDLAQHLSYLSDALALAQADRFVEYARFMRGFLARRGAPPADLAESLAALRVALGASAPSAALAAAPLIDAARAAREAP